MVDGPRPVSAPLTRGTHERPLGKKNGLAGAGGYLAPAQTLTVAKGGNAPASDSSYSPALGCEATSLT